MTVIHLQMMLIWGSTDATSWFHDNDSDSFSDINDSLTQCNQPADYIADSSDCDDDNAAMQSASEVCDGVTTTVIMTSMTLTVQSRVNLPSLLILTWTVSLVQRR